MSGPASGRRRGGRLIAAVGRLRPWQKAAAILAAGVLGTLLLFVLRPRPPLQEPPRRVPSVSTVPASVRSGHLVVRGNGLVRPSAEIALSAQVTGRVARISPALVSGGRFRRGEVLLRIETADYENAVEIARAEVAERRVAVLQAEEEVELAREEYRRLEEREGRAPPADSSELGRLVFREPQLQAARAALQRAQARLADAELALARTAVRAPFDGIVRSETVDVGQLVSPGQSLARVYATDAAEIVVALSSEQAALIPSLWETRAGGVGEGIPATVYAEFGGVQHRWAAWVDRAEAALDERTRTVDVVVRVPRPFEAGPAKPGEGAPAAAEGEQPPGEREQPPGVREQPPGEAERPPLLLGAYATVDIRGRRLDRYVVLPRAALRDGEVIWTVVDDTLLAMLPVRLVQEVEDSVSILSDVADGTPVIVTPLAIVTDGMTVRAERRAEPLETGGAR